jgi:hypothetical protein
MKRAIAILAALVVPVTVSADVIRLKNGGKLEGVVVRDQGDGVVIRLKYATVTVEKDDIASVEKKAGAPGARGAAPRLARWDRCVEVLAPKAWDGSVRQVPALVIEEGPLRNVPYFSWRSGNYEFNLYGDPDAPAALELGVHKDLAKDEAARRKCLDSMAELLGDPKDAETLRSIGLAEGKKPREGFVFEVTPPSAPDASGAWWVTVSDSAALEKARATQEEIDRITATREEMERLEREAKEAEKKRREEEAAKKKAEPKKPDPAPRPDDPKPPAATSGGDDDDWEDVALWTYSNGAWIRRPRLPGADTKPANPPRYYTPGYSRPSGGYRAGPRPRAGRR